MILIVIIIVVIIVVIAVRTIQPFNMYQGKEATLTATMNAAEDSTTVACCQGKRLSALRLVRAGGIMLSEGMRSVGDTTVVDTTTLTRIVPSQDLVNSIVSRMGGDGQLVVLGTGDDDEATLFLKAVNINMLNKIK